MISLYTQKQWEEMNLPLLRKYRAEKSMILGSYVTKPNIDRVIVGGNEF